MDSGTPLEEDPFSNLGTEMKEAPTAATRSYAMIRKSLEPAGVHLRKIPGLLGVVTWLEGLLMPSQPVRVVTKRGFDIWVDPRDHAVARTLIAQGSWQEGEARFLETVLHSGDVVMDVGANLGYFTGVMAGRVGASGVVLAYEPDPVNFALLSRTAETNHWNNVRLRNMAIGAEDGWLTLHTDPSNWGNHSLATLPGVKNSTVVVVPVSTLEGQFATEKSERIDLVKMDIQGWEAYAIRGTGRMAEDNTILLLEFFPEALIAAETNPASFLEELQEWGPIHLLNGKTGRLTPCAPDEVVAACRERSDRQVDLVVGRSDRLTPMIQDLEPRLNQ